MQIASGLHRVGSEIVNSYLIVGPDGVTIIDAGLPGYWKLLQAGLAAMGKSLGDVRALILTHGDTDHIGLRRPAAPRDRRHGVHSRGGRRPCTPEGKEAQLGLGAGQDRPAGRLPVVLCPAGWAAAPAGHRTADRRRRGRARRARAGTAAFPRRSG